MTPAEEYHLALKTLQEYPEGQELVREVANVSQFFGAYLVELIDGKQELSATLQPYLASFLAHDMGRMVVRLMGKEMVADVIEKNLILFLGRGVQAARLLDAQSLDEKISFTIKMLVCLSVKVSEWNVVLDESLRHVHDKKERRERRHHLQQEIKHKTSDDLPHLTEELLHKAMAVLLPQGASSLYLPVGGELFLPKISELIEACLPKLAVLVEKSLFSSKLKYELLFRAFSSVYSSLLQVKKAEEDSHGPVLPAHVRQLEPAINPFCHAFFPVLLTSTVDVRSDLIAEKMLGSFRDGLHSVSLVSLFFTGCLRLAKSSEMSISLHTEKEVSDLIATMAQDKRVVEGIVRKIISSPDLPTPAKGGVANALFELLIYGLKNSAVEIMAQGAIASFPWEEAQNLALERIRWFVLSPYFDQAVLESLISL